MKKPYQIEAQRAVKQLEAMAADGNPAVQMVLPMAEMVGWLRKGVGELIRQAGLQLMDLLMQEEVRGLAGERSQRPPEREGSPVGHRTWLLRGDGPEGSSPAAASADGRRQRGPIRKLRNVPPRRAADRNRVGAVDARTEHEEIRRIGARVYGGIRAGEERRQRTFHRSEPGEVEGHDGAPAGQDAAVRVADRRNAIRRAADGGCVGHR